MRLGSIRVKLLTIAGALLVPVVVMGLVTYASFESQLEASRAVRQTLDVIVLAQQLDGHLLGMQAGLDRYVLVRDAAAAQAADRAGDAFLAALADLERLTGDTPVQAARLGALRTAVRGWREGAAGAAIRAAEGDRRPRVLDLAREARDAMDTLRLEMRDFIRFEEQRLSQRTRAHEAAQRHARLSLILGGAGILGLGASASILLARRVIRPLATLTHALERIAAGVLGRQVSAESADEVGRLAVGFNRMVAEATQRQEALDGARREAETLVEVQRDLAETLDLVPVLQKIARHARLLCRSDLAYIAAFDARAAAARVVAVVGERSAALHGLRIEPGRGVGGRALETRRPFSTANYLADPRLQDRYADPVIVEGITAALAVPMVLEQQVIGLIIVGNRTARAFSEHDETILLQLAVPAALAIRNARLVGELAQERDVLAVRSRELARSEAQLRGIVEAAGDAIMTIDQQGLIRSVNRATEMMFGYSQQELLDQNLHTLIPSPDDAAVLGARGLRTELEGLRRDGTRFPIELSVSIVQTGHDRFFAVVVRDITERKRAYETRLQLAAIVESSADAIIGLDLDRVIESWNPGAERLFGYSADEVKGRSLSILLPPGVAAKDAAPILERMGDRVDNYETMWMRKDGSQIDVSLTVSPIRDATGAITGISTIARDITERKATERLKDEFIATVSHELRTPLTAIRGHIELVLDEDAGPVTDLQQQFLRIASQNTDRLGALINDLLDVEKLEAGKMQIRRDPVDLAEILQEVIATFRLEAERKGLRFSEEIAKLPTVIGDRDRLIQVFGNLVSNAIKYTIEGEVGISATRIDGQIEVVVHDTGVGMSAEEQQQLFSKFFRSQEAVVRAAGGTGLGLVIVKGIVERHGGRIRVESQKGAGSRFRVLLPIGPVGADPGARTQPGGATVTGRAAGLP